MNKFQSLLLPLAFLGMVPCLKAQQPLSLDEAVRIALQRSLSLQIQRNDVAAAQLLNDYGVAGGLPTVTATANDQAQVTNIYQKLATGTEIQRNGALGNNLTAAVAGSMVLYNGMRISATKDRLEQLERMNQQELSAQILDLTAAVTTQYYDVRRQQAYLKTLQGSLTVATQNREIVQARQAAGLANDADLFQAKLDENSLKQQILSQELAITQAKADLLDLMDEQPGKDVALSDSIVVNSNLNWDELLAGTRQHPRVAAATSQIQIQTLIERETSSQRLPTLRANAGLTFGNSVSNGGFNLVSRTYGPYAGLNLSIPIYNGGAVKRQEEVAALTT
ncbi:MAG: TolC family protein, partial [Bacteroidia bacterium]